MYTHTHTHTRTDSCCQSWPAVSQVCNVTSVGSPSRDRMNSLALLLRFTVLHEYYITGILIIPGHIVIFMLCYHRSCDSSIGLHVLFMGKEVRFTISFQEPKAGIYCQLSIRSCHYCLHQQCWNLFRQEKKWIVRRVRRCYSLRCQVMGKWARCGSPLVSFKVAKCNF